MRKKTFLKILLGTVAALLLLGLYGLWRFTTWLDFEGWEHLTQTAITAAPPDPAAPLEEPGDGSRATVRVAEASGAPAAAPDTGRLRGRCVDEQRRPLPRVRIAAGQRGTAPSCTGVDGRFALDLPVAERRVPATYEVTFESHGCRQLTRRCSVYFAREIDLGDLVLQPGGEIRGVVLTADGQPAVATVECHTWAPLFWPTEFFDASGDRLAATESAADGTFTLTGIRPGRVRVSAKAAATGYAHSAAIDVQAGMAGSGLVLKLPRVDPALTLGGRVVDEEGRGVAGAELRLVGRHAWYPTQEQTMGRETDADGRFRLEPCFAISGLKLDWRMISVDVTALDPAALREPVTLRAVPFGRQDVLLRFDRPLRPITVSVRDPDGAPVERFALTRIEPDGPLLRQRLRATVHPQGHVQFGASLLPFRVEIGSSGFQTAVQGPFTAATVGDVLVVQLARLSCLTGSVHGDGRPLAGARVQFLPAVDAQRDVTINDLPCFADRGQATEPVRSDAAGRFALPLPQRWGGYLRVTHDDFAPLLLGPRDWDAEREPAVGEVRLVHGGALEGKVVQPAAEWRPGSAVWITLGDGHMECAPPGPDGGYRFERLTPGRWRVELRDRIWDGSMSTSSNVRAEPVDAVSAFPWNVEVRDGETTRFDLRSAERATLRGCLRLGGQPCAGFTVQVAGAPGPAAVATTTAADGRFELALPRGERARLVLRGELAEDVTLRLTCEGVAADRELVLDLPAGGVSGRLPPGPGERISRLEYVWQGTVDGKALRAQVAFAANDDQSFVLGAVPAGDGEIVRFVAEATGRETRSPLGKVQVRPGQQAAFLGR